ncbi:MAG: LysR family transcriptional regulator [Curvibacter sp.]|nr:LysR family transcriptional regulator [Curvibacter sp.]
MNFDNLDDLHVLLAAAETRSFTQAGRRCGLSTAAVSSAIKRLEQALGVRLFDRSTRSVQATHEGEVMIDHARRALDLLAQGQALVRGAGSPLAGPVRITVATTLARAFLADWLAGFAQRHPGLEIDLQVTDAELDLLRDGIDMAVRTGPLPDSGLAARLLANSHRVACASPDYLARHGRPEHPQALVGHACLVYQVRGRRLNDWTFSRPECGGAAPQEPIHVRVQGALSCNDASIAQQWALQGRGVAYLSELGLAEALRQGTLVRLFPDHVGEPAPLYAVLPSNRFVPPRVGLLVEALAVLFASPGGPGRLSGG